MKILFRTLLAVLLAPSAWAYVLDTDAESDLYVTAWDQGVIPMQIKLPTSPTLLDGTNYASSVQAAMQAWNTQLGTVQFTWQIIETPINPPPGTYSTSPSNTANEIVMNNTFGGMAFDDSTLAVTTTFTSGNSRVQSDIVINSAWSWNSFQGGRSSNIHDIRRVVIHELGHALGLNHPDQATPQQTVTAIMNSHVSYSPPIDTMQADDIAGAQLLYAAPGFVPANNDFLNATTITLTSSSIQLTGTNVAANRQSGEPNHAGANAIGHSVWWKWTAPGNGSTTITTLGSNYDTVVAVYTGTAVNSLTAIASNDDVQNGVIRTSTVTFNAIAGTTYFIAVDGWGSSGDEQFTYTGAITLNMNYAGTIGGTIAPSITTQPVSQTVATGTAVTFTAAASGNPAPTYQWRKNGVNLAGATDSSYTIASPSASDAASYTVLATNSAGSATSNAAVLTVTAVPVITTQPLSQTVAAGTAVTFTAAASGSPAPTYQWRKNAVNLAGATNTSYTIASPSVSDAASYTVVATNSAGSATSNAAVLTVIVVPSSAIISITVE